MIAELIAELRRDAEAVSLLKDWLGDDLPISKFEAEQRAIICVACPKNRHAGWWDHAKDAVAGVIRKQLSLKHKLKLETCLDGSLHLCECCGCANKLKVWVPMHHVYKHTPKEVYDKFPDFCWVRQGIDRLRKEEPAPRRD